MEIYSLPQEKAKGKYILYLPSPWPPFEAALSIHDASFSLKKYFLEGIHGNETDYHHCRIISFLNMFLEKNRSVVMMSQTNLTVKIYIYIYIYIYICVCVCVYVCVT